jgi:hypothetical protein
LVGVVAVLNGDHSPETSRCVVLDKDGVIVGVVVVDAGAGTGADAEVVSIGVGFTDRSLAGGRGGNCVGA